MSSLVSPNERAPVLQAALSRKVGIVLGILLIVLLAIGMVSYWLVHSFSGAATSVVRTAEALNVMEQLRSFMNDADVGLRRFVLTGQSESLRPIETARTAMEPAVERLSEWTRYEPSEQPRIDAFRSVMREFFAGMDDLVKLRTARGSEAAIEAMRSRIVPQPIDAARHLLKQMHERAGTQLADQQDQLVALRRTAILCIVGGSVLTLMIVALAGGLVLYDLKRLERAERALQISQNRQELVLNTLPIVMYSAAPSGNFGAMWISENAIQVTGYPSERFVHEPQLWSERLHPEDRDRVLDHFGRLEKEELIETEYRWQIADGSYHWFVDEARLVRRPDGTPLEVVGMWYDVTERRRIEGDLRQTARLLQSVFDASPPAIVAVGSDGRVLIWNRSAERLFGWKPEEVMGRALPTVSGDLAEQHRMFRERVFRGETLTDLEVFRLRRDGALVQVSMSVAPIYDAQGAIYGAMAVFVDISDRKRAEQQLRDSSKQLRALARRAEAVREEERTRIAREVHDELGQAMTALKVDVSWVYKHVAGLRDLPQQEALLSRLQGTMSMLDTTIRSVRQIATALRPGVLDELGLAAAVDWYAQDFEQRTGIACRVTIRPHDLAVDSERSTALFRIVQELMTNVARHAQATKVDIALVDAEGQLTLEVEDNGKGIPDDQIDNVHALGLVGVRERASQWGGGATFRGLPEGGTAVIVTIPHARVGS